MRWFIVQGVEPARSTPFFYVGAIALMNARAVTKPVPATLHTPS
jgi:hypothetical protein